jgi:hypothetical protein
MSCNDLTKAVADFRTSYETNVGNDKDTLKRKRVTKYAKAAGYEIVADVSRFARDQIIQETGWRYLQDTGITLIAADRPDAKSRAGVTADGKRYAATAVARMIAA